MDWNEMKKELARRLPSRDPLGNKGTFGTLSVVTGSALFRGAASLCSEAALRCGVGVLRLASVEKVVSAVASRLPEAVFLPLEENASGGISGEDFARKLPALASSKALLLGPGLTDSPDTAWVVEEAVKKTACPLLLDADALNVLKGNSLLLREAALPPVITPHVGEMARLCGKKIEEIKADRREVALRYAKEWHCTVVLKDAVTAIASFDGRFFLLDSPNSGLSKGGSGDVLSGMAAAFLCEGKEGFEAAECAVLLHSLAGRAAAERLTESAMLPSDLLAEIPGVFASLRPFGTP